MIENIVIALKFLFIFVCMQIILLSCGWFLSGDINPMNYTLFGKLVYILLTYGIIRSAAETATEKH
jgi:hypothetical protein